ncbi:MAG: hypothetical protein JWQ95_5066 [Sphaerisporangium sp.]|jgi:hypothetical protein|nr:hypothetical protein [Sphaerisporangium sp.]
MWMAPVITVGVSGPDNVGKTTQARLLARRYRARNLGPLDDHDPRWQHARRQGLAAWWFEAAPLQEVVDVLACSYLARSTAAQSSPPGTEETVALARNFGLSPVHQGSRPDLHGRDGVHMSTLGFQATATTWLPR